MRLFKRFLSGILALTMLVSLCAGTTLPKASAASTSANVAYGKSVAFGYGAEVVSGDGDYGVSAVKNGLSVLTDGVNDSANWWVNNGNPYVALKNSVITGPYIFSVDLGGSFDVDQVSIYSYGRSKWGVCPADAVTFTASTDGTTWTTLGTVALADAVVNTFEDPRYAGTEDAIVDIYEFRLAVDASARYVRATFSANDSGMVGMGEFEVYGVPGASNISQGAEITYFGYGSETGSDANWGSAAVNSGLSVLTDGETSSPNWWVNNGNPNIGLKSSVLSGPYVINLGLGSASLVSEISTYFYSRTDWGVDRPDAVTYSVSTDGIYWTEAGTVTAGQSVGTTIDDSRNPTEQKPTIYRYTLEMEDTDALYVKVTFDTNSVGLVGLQEIEVLGVSKTITNLALGKLSDTKNYTYQITGGGTGYESSGTTDANGNRYTISDVENSSISRLTDGVIINSSAVTYGSSWGSADWNSSGTIMSKYMQIYRNDSRIITLDLGAMRNVTGIRMHFAAREASGFYMPTNVTYYLSADGENFYEVADVWNYDAIADTNDSNISGSGVPRHDWYSAQNINFNARYVKIIFPVNVYILSDELQVYGSEVLSANPTDLTSCPWYDPLEDYVGHYANLSQSGGVKNEFMAYSGWYINSDGNEVYNTYKTVDEYMCALAYVDENGVPQDWMFDDMTVMSHYYTSSGTFNSYKAGYTSGSYYADQDDWYEWLCYAFGKDANGNALSYDGYTTINLNALEEAARIAKETLNDPDYKVGVKLVLFPAVEYQDDWGTINGKYIDFTIDGAGSQAAALENRRAAYQWYIDTAVEMWENAGFEHLELTGFYYYEETIHESTDRIARAATQALTDIVHTHVTPSTNTKPAFDSDQGGHLYIYQLPYYQSEGYWNWAEYGFDYALMQPNYSFYDMYTLTQLEECGNLCKYYGLGMQMEFGGTASDTYKSKFKDYLTYGDDFGYQNAVLSWYMSTWGCYEMSNDKNSTRYLYDMVYEFVKIQNANLIAGCAHDAHTQAGECTICLSQVEHSYVDGVCTVCGINGAVCSVTIGETTTYFDTLQGAFDYAAENAASTSVEAPAKIVLLADVTECVSMGISYVELDLNDKVLSGDGTGRVITTASYSDGDVYLTITDSSTEQTTRCFAVNDGGLWTLDEAGTETVTGGIITGGVGGVSFSGNMLTLAGGTIVGNQAVDGGGVIAYGRVMQMTGGAILGNVASTSGGGVYVSGCSFNMSGGTIAGNTSESKGGGIYVTGYKGCTVSGGTISGNTSGCGGGICTEMGAKVSVSGGLIEDNTARSGGGIYLSDEDIADLTGGTITGNVGGGIVMCGEVNASLSGSIRIYDNTDSSGAARNLYFRIQYVNNVAKYATLKIESALSEDAYIGVKMEERIGVFAQPYGTEITDLSAIAGYFFADEEIYTVAVTEDGCLRLSCSGDHTDAEGDNVCDVCGADIPVELFDIPLASMTMGNSLAINFAFEQSNMADWTGCYAQIVKTYADGRADAVENVPYTEWKSTTISGAGYYYVTFNGIAAKEMCDEVCVTIYNAEGVAISNTKTDSVRGQSMRVLAKTGITDKEKTMVVDMLNYGAAAQEHFSYGTDDLANVQLSAEQQAYASEFQACTSSRTSTGEIFYGSSVVLKSNIQLLFAFKNIDESHYAVVTFTDHYGKAKVLTISGSSFSASGSYYVVNVNSLVVADGRQDVTCTIYDASGNEVGSVTDSLASYTARSGEELCVRMMQYSDSAYAFFH